MTAAPQFRRHYITAALICAMTFSSALAFADNTDINPGTPGADLPTAPASPTEAGTTIAIFGDLAPVNDSSPRYLSEAIKEANLLRPSAVFTVGGLIPGLDRSPTRYQEEAKQLRAPSNGGLDALKMPWYPCVGQTDVLSGNRSTTDHTFEAEYQKAFGPLYYSVDVGDAEKKMLHAIVLDSEEGLGAGNTISDEQLSWLKSDLRKTFERAAAKGAPKWVIVLTHRPLWRIEKQTGRGAANWDRVHQLLVDFNERPIVSVEGGGGGGSGFGDGPRVVGVYAGDERAYSKEPTRDGIRYTVLGPTAAREKEGAAGEALRSLLLLKLDMRDGGSHPAIVRLDKSDSAIVADDAVTEPERKVLDAMAAIPEEVLGVEGAVDTEGNSGKLSMHVGNPLDVPLDIQIRLASTRSLTTSIAQENANPFVENFDAPWEMTIPHQIRHLQPGAKETWPMELNWLGGDERMPAQVEFVLRWKDERGGGAGSDAGKIKEVVLKRRVPVIPHAQIPVAAKVDANGTLGWENAAEGATYAWEPHEDELKQRSPQWSMIADKSNLFVRVRVDDAVKSYSPNMDLDKKWGGLASDAVNIAWANTAVGAADPAIHRIWAVPFGPKGLELLTNAGVETRQTKLQPLDAKVLPISATVESRLEGYTVTFIIPRQTLSLTAGKSLRMNISVHDNNNTAQTWVRSWAKEDLGVTGWGRVSIRDVAVFPASTP